MMMLQNISTPFIQLNTFVLVLYRKKKSLIRNLRVFQKIIHLQMDNACIFADLSSFVFFFFLIDSPFHSGGPWH